MKRRKILLLSLAALMPASACALGVVYTNGGGSEYYKPDNDSFELSELSGIKLNLLSERDNIDGTVSKVVGYTLTPASSTSVDFGFYTDWDTANSSLYESDDWENTKKVADYLTFQSDTVNKTINFTCLKPFGTKIILTMVSEDNPEIKASININYRRKKLKDATAVLSSTVLEKNAVIKVTSEKGLYSIGTIGDKPSTDMPALKTTFKETGTYTYDSLFGEIIYKNIYSQSYKYQGTDYDQKENVRIAIKEKISSYLFSLPTVDGSKTLDVVQFRNLFTYEYAAYRTYETVYLKSTDLFSQFVNKYTEAYANGAGINVEVTWNGKQVLSQRLSMSLDSTTIEGINVVDPIIEF